jgi:hypothetical protein
MSKLLRLYNSWDQYSCGDFESKDEVSLNSIGGRKATLASHSHFSFLTLFLQCDVEVETLSIAAT